MGPNAFAFPSGKVVATVPFLELCNESEQQIAVFLHEIAHVERQHGIRSLIQRGGVFLVFSLLIGDASSVISLAEGLPALLMNSRYSQRFELESDLYSAEVLERAGIGAGAMKDALLKLHRGSPDMPIAELVSSHPGLGKRVKAIEEISESPGSRE